MFLDAPWSGPSRVARHSLLSAVTRIGLPESTVLVVNLDENPAVHEMPELEDKIHGWGEAFVVRDGQILGLRALGRNQKLHHEVSAEIAHLLSDFRLKPPQM